MRDMNEPMPLRRVTIEKMRFTLQTILARHFVEAMADVEMEAHCDFMVAELTGIVYGEKLGMHRVQYPRDWWQALKVRWFPRWARRRWPVIYAVREFEAAALYPDHRSIFPGERVVVALLDQGTTEFTHHLVADRGSNANCNP